jgi:hypothetical protein
MLDCRLLICRFGGLPCRQVAVRLVGDHLDPAGDLTAVLDLQPAATRSPEHAAAAADYKAAARRERAIDGPGYLRVLDLDFALEDAARGDREFGRMDHRRFDSSLHDQPFSVLNHALDADAAPDNKCPAFGRIARGRAPHCDSGSCGGG